MMPQTSTKDSPRPRVGVKPPPGGAVGGCPGCKPGPLFSRGLRRAIYFCERQP